MSEKKKPIRRLKKMTEITNIKNIPLKVFEINNFIDQSIRVFRYISQTLFQLGLI
jgi:hypothetical protein